MAKAKTNEQGQRVDEYGDPLGEVCLWVQVVRGDSYGGDACIKIVATPVYVGGKKYESQGYIRSISGSSYGVGADEEFADFQIEFRIYRSSSIYTPSDGAATWVAEDWGYEGLRGNNAERFLRAGRFLDNIRKRLQRMNETEGDLPQHSYGLAFSRLVRAMGIKQVLFKGEQARGRGWDYDDFSHSTHTPGTAGSRLAYQIESARLELAPETSDR